MSDVDAVWPGGADGADDGVEGWDLPFDGGLREAYDLMNDENFAGLETHEEMLSDRVRVEAYHRGIHRHVAKGDVVVDLGTGTGLLAFMASRAGAKTVYAVEHSDFIDLAREIAEYNGFTNIEFIRANSREFTPPEPIDVVLHEQMGDELFNENMLENVLDLRDRALAPSGRILPSRFRLFVEPFSMRDDMRIRRFWNIDLPDGIDLSFAEQSPVAARFNAFRNEEFWLRPHSVEATIGRPQPILEFDLNTIEHPDELPLRHRVERTATADTIVDGCCVWFEACFDDDTTLSTSPLEPVTSWGNRVFRLDQQIARGEALRLDVRLGDLVEPSTWSVRAL
ncbi:MAG: methyltransferase domain-containing protein [Candidatus Microthrix sp.]|nr:methyltransferase domain-containing protein [Candidatus Microthrix sp.]MBP9067676.1 methyltransferase domain-containing protein [Candidatus Microthrix sp.]